MPAESAETQDRTGDTAIFSRVLYQLSYLGLPSLSEREDFTILGKIVKKRPNPLFLDATRGFFYRDFTSQPYPDNLTGLQWAL